MPGPQEETRARAFGGISVAKGRAGGQLRTGSFQQALVAWYLALGDLGQRSVGLGESDEGGGSGLSVRPWAELLSLCLSKDGPCPRSASPRQPGSTGRSIPTPEVGSGSECSLGWRRAGVGLPAAPSRPCRSLPVCRRGPQLRPVAGRDQKAGPGADRGEAQVSQEEEEVVPPASVTRINIFPGVPRRPKERRRRGGAGRGECGRGRRAAHARPTCPSQRPVAAPAPRWRR